MAHNVNLRLSKSDLRNNSCKSVALDTFKSMRLKTKQIVQTQLSPLDVTERKLIIAQLQEALNADNNHVVGYTCHRRLIISHQQPVSKRIIVQHRARSDGHKWRANIQGVNR